MLHFLAVGHFYSYFFKPTKCLTKYVLCVFRSRSRSPKRRRSHSRSQSPRSDKQLIFFFSVNTFYYHFSSVMCSSRKYPYPPQGWSLEISKGREVSLAQIFFTESMKLNWKFQGDGRVQTKEPSLGDVWLFFGATQSTLFSKSRTRVNYYMYMYM